MKYTAKFTWHYWAICPKCKHMITETVDADTPRVISIRCPNCQEIIYNQAFDRVENRKEVGG